MTSMRFFLIAVATVVGAWEVVRGRRMRAREAGTGTGEVVDVALYESIFSLMESLISDYDAFGVEPPERAIVNRPCSPIDSCANS